MIRPRTREPSSDRTIFLLERSSVVSRCRSRELGLRLPGPRAKLRNEPKPLPCRVLDYAFCETNPGFCPPSSRISVQTQFVRKCLSLWSFFLGARSAAKLRNEPNARLKCSVSAFSPIAELKLRAGSSPPSHFGFRPRCTRWRFPCGSAAKLRNKANACALLAPTSALLRSKPNLSGTATLSPVAAYGQPGGWECSGATVSDTKVRT
jgi:hypothetical protein